MYSKQEIDQLQKELHQQAVDRGWWDDPNRCVVQALQLVNTEIAEATEANRRNLMDDKLPQYKGEAVELADAFIRILDIAGHEGWKYLGPGLNIKLSTENLASEHLLLTDAVCTLGLFTLCDTHVEENLFGLTYTEVLNRIMHIAHRHEYGLCAIVQDKAEFNKTRSDHDRDIRNTLHGKRY